MSGAKRAALATAVAVTTLLTSSCILVPSSDTLTAEDLNVLLSELICYPEMTCEELRTMFDVEYLPIVDYPDEIGINYEEHWISTDDGQTFARYGTCRRGSIAGTVILSIGSVGNLACYLFVARLLIDNGWSVVMYEYRGFGGSSGRTDLFALHADLSAVLSWTVHNTGRSQATLLGISLGSIPSVSVAAEHPEQVNGVILDSPVALGAEIERFENFLGKRTQEIIDRLPLNLVSEAVIKDLRDPLLIFRSMIDNITPPESVQLLYDNAPGLKEMVTFPTLEHADGPYHDTGAYSYYMEAFLSRLWDQYTPIIVQHDGDDN